MSTGAATIREIQEALEVIKYFGNKQVLLFHCISSYPALLKDLGLLSIKYLRNKYNVEVGLSDHTIGPHAAIIAASLGAVAIEKHFTLSRADGGPDSTFSMEPNEFKDMTKKLDLTVKALGKNLLTRSKSEKQSHSNRKSIYFINDLKKGYKIRKKDIKVIRPGNGLHPKLLNDVIGSTLMKSVSYGDATSYKNIKFKKKTNIYIENKGLIFEEIIPNKKQIKILYNFLKNRKHSISHNILPKKKEHFNFVKNHPYRYWFLVKYNNKIVGSIYIQNDNSIGINFEFKLIKFRFDQLIKKIKSIISPLPDKIKKDKRFFYKCIPTKY